METSSWRLVVGLVEAALEPLPDAIFAHIVPRQNFTKNRNLHRKLKEEPPKRPLLDVAIHHQWMGELKDKEKRGRPDLVHRALLTLLESPLARHNQLEVFVETYSGALVWILSGTRLPRNYNRFCGLWSTILTETTLTPISEMLNRLYDSSRGQDGPRLFRLEGTVEQLLTAWKPSTITTLSTDGTGIRLMPLASLLLNQPRPVLLAGGFQGGQYAKRTTALTTSTYRLYTEEYPLSTILSRVLGALEITQNLDIP